jgi:hypothetical protein
MSRVLMGMAGFLIGMIMIVAIIALGAATLVVASSFINALLS